MGFLVVLEPNSTIGLAYALEGAKTFMGTNAPMISVSLVTHIPGFLLCEGDTQTGQATRRKMLVPLASVAAVLENPDGSSPSFGFRP